MIRAVLFRRRDATAGARPRGYILLAIDCLSHRTRCLRVVRESVTESRNRIGSGKSKEKQLRWNQGDRPWRIGEKTKVFNEGAGITGAGEKSVTS